MDPCDLSRGLRDDVPGTYMHACALEGMNASIELLHSSLAALKQAVDKAVARESAGDAKLCAAAMAFFRFYAENPRDLYLGCYLFRGGVKPKGLGRARDELLNASLEAALRPIGDAAEALGTTRGQPDLLIVGVFAHATGLLLLPHTGRIRMFGASALALMERYVHGLIGRLKEDGVP